MKINTITVTAGRTFNHPHEQYSNLRPEVSMTATLEDGNDIKTVQELLGHEDLNTTAIYLHADAARGFSPLDAIARPVQIIPQIQFQTT